MCLVFQTNQSGTHRNLRIIDAGGGGRGCLSFHGELNPRVLLVEVIKEVTQFIRTVLPNDESIINVSKP